MTFLKRTIPAIIGLLLVLTIYAQQVDKKIPDSANKMTNPTKCDEKAVASAAKIYKKVCWTCHGDNGKGNGPGSFEIKTKVADFKNPIVMGRTDGALHWWISKGGNDMQPYKDVLTKTEIWSLVCYVRNVQGK